MIYMGIDPGLSKSSPGGIAVIQVCKIAVTNAVWPMPQKNEEIHNRLSLIKDVAATTPILCYIEDQHIFRESPSRKRDMGKERALIMHYGALLAILEIVGIVPHPVASKVWQNRILGPMVKGETKTVSLGLARKSYPELAAWLKNANDHGKADALHLAEYARVMGKIA